MSPLISSSLVNSPCPYLGLKAYRNNSKDVRCFFGREDISQEILNKLQYHNFLAILGASGCGKSSLLQAGLLYPLSSSQEGEIKLIQPSHHPLKSLAMAFLDASLTKLEKAEQITEIKTYLERNSDGFSYFLNTFSSSKVILAIDHFEEIFTLCQSPQERLQFLANLFTALDQNRDQLTIITVIDAPFLGHCLEQEPRELGKRIQENLVAIPSLTRHQCYDALTLPAKQANLDLDPYLVEQLLKDIEGVKGSLPLLQYTIRQIWQYNSGSRLDLGTYQKLGSINTILDQQATQIFQKFTPLQQKTTQKLFLSLIHTDEEMRNVCQDVELKKVRKLPDFKLILDTFKQAGFIEAQERDNIARTETLLRLTHPIIMEHWGLLQQWLDQRRYYLRQQKNLEYAAQQWHNLRRNKAYLLTGDRLKVAKYLKRKNTKCSALTQEFIRQSLNQKKRQTFLYIVLPITLITFLGTSFYRYWQIQKAWQTLDLVKNNPYDSRRKDALETLNFWEIDLKNISLASTELSQINLPKANLENIDLSGATLESSNLSQANLVNTNLDNTNLSNSILVQSNLAHNDLSLTNLRQANLSKANLIHTNLDFSNLIFANLSSANLSQSSLNFTHLENANLAQANLSNSNLSNADLGFSNLSWANLANADLWSANLSESNLLSVDLTNANLYNTYLINTKNLDPTRLKTACFWQQAYYQGKWNAQQEKWEIDQTANQQFIQQLQQDTTSDPQIPPVCQRWQ